MFPSFEIGTMNGEVFHSKNSKLSRVDSDLASNGIFILILKSSQNCESMYNLSSKSMTKTTLRLIGNLNNLYEQLWKEWILTETDSFEFKEYQQKMKLVRTFAKRIEEQSRGFMKSKIDYKSWGVFILKSIEKNYLELHSELTNLLLQKTND